MIDSLNILDSIQSFPDQCQQVIGEISSQDIPHECYLVDNVVVSAMGGSALGARVIAAIERHFLRVPLVICSDYSLPNFVNDRTLVIVSSYSGNTRETLACLSQCVPRKAKVFIITAGGKLAQLVQSRQFPGYVIDPVHNPSGQPRMALGYSLIATIGLLARCQLIHPADNLNELPAYLRSLQKHTQSLSNLAVSLAGHIPLIVAAEHLKGSALAMRNQFHENAKTFSVFLDFPELNHHALESLRFPQTNPQILCGLFINSRLYTDPVSATFDLTKQVFAKNQLPTHNLSVSGPSALFESVGLLQSGAYLAFYLSQAHYVDPGPIPYVDWFKDQMQQRLPSAGYPT